MIYLLDSHTILWSSLQTHKLSKSAKAIIEDSSNEIHVSLVSFWEISIKHALGKIDLHGGTPEDLLKWCRKEGFRIMTLSENDATTFFKLPRTLHKDPFDRMLAWQTINRHYTLISNDQLLRFYVAYGLKLFW